jgi:hypothetical protein
MKKSWTILLVLIILSSSLISLVSSVRINEVEANPNGTDSGNEWVELYSDIEIDLTNWTLRDLDNHTIELDQTFSGYLVINLEGTWLRNTNESVFLYNGTTPVDITGIINDDQDEQSWNYCDSSWEFRNPTQGTENNCTTSQQSPTENTDDDIYLEIEWDEEEIINGKEFDIKVKAYNLLDEKYNLKIWIKFDDNDTKISERYDEELEEWKSGNYYVDEFFNREGDDSKNIELRIDEDYEDYHGNDVEICFKLEDNPDTEECESIEILEKEEEKNKERTSLIQQNTNTNTPPKTITGNVITLGNSAETEDLKEQSNMLYQSKTELIKKYAVIVFAFFCVGLSALLVFNKLK